MRLYFLRHTDADSGFDDAARPLSALGRKQAEALGRFCHQAGVELDGAFASPLLRARQTAEVFLNACAASDHVKLKAADELLNEASEESFHEFLDGLGGFRRVLLVGHAPVLAERVRAMLGMGNEEALKLSKGGLACVRTDDYRTGSLKFFISPKLLHV